jgi:hypothetical protein
VQRRPDFAVMRNGCVAETASHVARMALILHLERRALWVAVREEQPGGCHERRAHVAVLSARCGPRRSFPVRSLFMSPMSHDDGTALWEGNHE